MLGFRDSLHNYFDMDYLIRSAQHHESFRRPELEALAALSRADLKIVEYDQEASVPKQETVC
jgi:tRNA G10  N-methylase Trm11